MFVRIDNPVFERSVELRAGEELVFGREATGAGQLPDNALVSRRHGIITATEHGFAVTSVGTYSGFVVRDTMTPSRLHLPRGVGPIELPFAKATISFDHSVPGRLEVEVVGCERATEWERSWAPEAEHAADVAERDARRRSSSQPPPRLKRKARGEPYSWFWTLVAMCEGEITGESAGVPSNSELGRRLVYETGIIERHVAAIYDALDVDLRTTAHARDTAVRRAVDRGLVTREHIAQLHARTGGR